MSTFESFKKQRRGRTGPWKTYDHRKVAVGHNWCACERCARFWFNRMKQGTQHKCGPATVRKSNGWGHCKKCDCRGFRPNMNKIGARSPLAIIQPVFASVWCTCSHARNEHK